MELEPIFFNDPSLSVIKKLNAYLPERVYMPGVDQFGGIAQFDLLYQCSWNEDDFYPA